MDRAGDLKKWFLMVEEGVGYGGKEKLKGGIYGENK